MRDEAARPAGGRVPLNWRQRMTSVLSKRVAESWQNPKVRQARTKRHAVVTSKGFYSCCRAAFDAYNLDMRYLTSVRKILKVKKHIRITPPAQGSSIEFGCVPFAKYQRFKCGKSDIRIEDIKTPTFEFQLEDAFSIAKKLPLPKYRKPR